MKPDPEKTPAPAHAQRRFAIERRIPLVLLFGLVLQTGGVLFWAGAAAERMTEVERQTRANATVIERVVRLEAEVTTQHEMLARIENKLDGIVAPLLKRGAAATR